MRRLGLGIPICMVVLFCIATTIASHTQTFTTLATFGGTNGEAPWNAPLVQGTDGNFYGTTLLGGTGSDASICTSCGTVFKVTPAGVLTTLWNFCSQTNCSDGARPATGLVLGANGNIYGTTTMGGTFSGSTMFEVTPAGVFSTVYQFCSLPNCADAPSSAGLTLAPNGNFYGAGTTVFEITPAGKYTTLATFCPKQGKCPDGSAPGGPLAVGTDGSIVGTTDTYGAHGFGTVFEVTAEGKLQNLHSFAKYDTFGAGTNVNGVILGADGNFYGTTFGGGVGDRGTVYRVTPFGHYATISNLDAAQGDEAESALVQGTDGNFYGTTYMGGTNIFGNIFQTTPSGTSTSVYGFCNGPGCPDGENPIAGLVQGTDGSFYGATTAGGNQSDCAGGCGTLYTLSMGLGSFVRSTPTMGKAGSKVLILGNDLTGTTSVTFDGISAKFSVVSSTYIQAMVPSGATSGTIQVATPGGTLNSNVAFTVIP